MAGLGVNDLTKLLAVKCQAVVTAGFTLGDQLDLTTEIRTYVNDLDAGAVDEASAEDINTTIYEDLKA